MYWEYRALLVERVAPELMGRLVARGTVGAATADAIEPSFLRRIIEVEDCPDDIDADASTPFVFKLASELSTRRGELVAPLDVAAAATELLRESMAGFAEPLFEFEIGGGGHLNAKRTAAFVPAFFAAAELRGASSFYATESFLTVPGTLEPSRELVADWEHIFAELRVAVGDEKAELAELCSRAESRQTPRAELLMMLAAASDCELSLRPFLLGLGGRQNVPWYLRRFLNDASAFAAECSSALQSHSRDVGLMPESLPPRFEELLILLLRLRSRYLIAARRRRPDQLLGHLLALVRAFYSNYNHPSVRALNESVISPAQLPQVLSLVSLTREAVFCGVQLVESCCEIEGFRLHIGKCG